MSTTLGKLREYETVLVINPELTDEQVGEIIDRLKGVLDKMSATLLREDHWGKRKMAFEAKKQGRGNYFLFHYVAPVGVVEELERTMRNLEHVHRFVTQLNGEVTDVEAKKTEVEKMVRERAAAKAKAEAERKERELAERSMGDDDDMDDDDREQAAG
ncbi:MAG: 30S ribosomal protein S6 [Myxococcales bacterium]|nr:30S ribosomal protein S6 [Myxococcales bacterium]MCB9648845.1 30S ribosomal protein S6 [Deltaproteobacteria bacterium]